MKITASHKQKPRSLRRPGVSVVGAGRLGTALALALESHGYRVEAVVTRHQATARRAAGLLSRSTRALTARRIEELPQSELILVATPDDAIAEIAAALAAAQRDRVRGRTVLHTSGACSSTALAALSEVGFNVGSIHPLVSVSEPRSGAAKLRGAFFCVEGERQAVRVARAVARALGGQSFSIDARYKPLYHAAAVTSSGFVVALFDVAVEMLSRCGLSRRRAQNILVPLIESAVSNLSSTTPAGARTGTFSRGDVATVRKHLAAINSENLSAALAVYATLGNRSLALAKESGTRGAGFDQIAEILAGI